ncbi:MAG: SirB2 family protein [Methylococcales bacterium]
MPLEVIKSIHVFCAVASISGFIARYFMREVGIAYLKRKWIIIVPHVIDTVLLITGIWQAVRLNLSPTVVPWLMAKIIALFLYVAIGIYTFRLAKNNNQRTIGFVLAIFSFFYIAVVAIFKTPLPV